MSHCHIIHVSIVWHRWRVFITSISFLRLLCPSLKCCPTKGRHVLIDKSIWCSTRPFYKAAKPFHLPTDIKVVSYCIYSKSVPFLRLITCKDILDTRCIKSKDIMDSGTLYQKTRRFTTLPGRVVCKDVSFTANKNVIK